MFWSKKKLWNLKRPMVILVKFQEPVTGALDTVNHLWAHFGTDNVLKPELLDKYTFRILWVNLNWFNKVTDEMISKVCGGKKCTVVTYPE